MPTRRTKIVATLGPSSHSRAEIERLVRVGMDVARMNFSHGSHEEHAARIATVRAASQACGRAVGVLQDLQGPKIRTGPLHGGTAVEIPTGGRFVLTTRPVDGDAEQVTTSYEPLPTDVEPGDRIFLSDGSIALRAIETTATDVVTEVVYGGTLKERQGINLPGVRISAAGVTEKDVRDLAFGLEQDVDYVAISFVRSADDVLHVKRLVAEHGCDTPVIAKLEKPEAIEALPAILDAADGVMVARGDLGVELSPEKVPLVQKRIIEEANRRAKPVITATQMLESMVSSPRPTRAEASDVANAILDGSDAVMLSAETAMGRYPVESIETMARIAEEVEAGSRSNRDATADHSFVGDRRAPEAIGAAVDAVIDALPEVTSVWVFTQSGSTARLIAHHRPGVPVVAFTPSLSCYRRLSLVWGITPILTEAVSNFRELSDLVFPLALHHEIAQSGDTVVITGSHPFDSAAPTNFLKLHTV